MVNKVFLLGNVGTDPQVSGNETSKMVSFALATQERYRRNNEISESTEWHKVVAFGNLATFASQYVAKGKQIFVEGKIHTRQYSDRDGVERTITEIVANDIKLCGKKEQ